MQVCGRNYQVVEHHVVHSKDLRKARNRVHVEGLTKADGGPIRFKSVEKAERHIRNMRLEKV